MIVSLRSYLANGSLWSEIKNVEDFPFIGESPDFLDTLQVLTYGDRTVFTPFIEVSLPDVAPVIVKLFSDKWNSLLEAKISDINILADGNKITTVDNETVTVGNDSGEASNSVAVQNVDDLVTESGSSNTIESNKKVEGVTTKNESVVNYKNLFNNLNMLEKNNILDVVLLDASKYLTLQTY